LAVPPPRLYSRRRNERSSSAVIQKETLPCLNSRVAAHSSPRKSANKDRVSDIVDGMRHRRGFIPRPSGMLW
jgi:hypothetical protein